MWREWSSDLFYRIRALFRRGAMERELNDELRFHIEQHAAALERDGMSKETALRAARLAFGGVEQVKEESRDVRGTVLLETLLQDVRYAVRRLRARPGFTAGVVLTFSLGIGANAAMFGIVDRLLLRPPEYLRDPARVHRLYMQRMRYHETRADPNTSMGRFLDLRRLTRTLSTVAGFSTMTVAVGEGDKTRELPVAAVSAAYFDLFSARPAVGRFFGAAEDSMPTGTPVVVLGHAYWRSEFNARADVVGKQLRVGRMLFTVIGVAPKNFVGFDDSRVPAMYMPLTAFAWNTRPEDHTRDYHWGWLSIVVERAPNVSVDVATADLTHALQRSRLSEHPDDLKWSRTVEGEHHQAILAPVQAARGPGAGPDSQILIWVAGVALIVLLIACANVANLLLARALSRQREIALRLALGVSRGRLARQLITESLVFALLGGAVGLAIAQWGGAVIRALFLPNGTEGAVLADERTVGITIIVTFGAALLTGLAPASEAWRYDLARSLNAGGRDAGVRRSPLRVALLVLQATLSVVLLVGAGLFVRSLANVRQLHLGYDVDPVLIVTEQKRGVKMKPTEQAILEHRLVATARTLPGVIAATPAPSIPFWAYEGRELHVAGIDSVDLLGEFTMQAGNEDYFRVMGTRIVRGRGFTTMDRAGAPRVTVVSERMARALWPAQDPLGKCIRIDADTMPCTTVIGVAEDLHMSSLNSAREFTYYVPIEQYDMGATDMLLLRVAGDASSYAEAMRRGLQPLMPGASYLTAIPLRDAVDPQMRSWRLGATMFTAFGALALVLAAIGLYGVVSHSVTQRRREIGVRLALGARPPQVIALVLRGGLQLVVVGVVLGGAIAAWAGRWIGNLLFNESATDPVVYVGVAAILVLVATMASLVPALAASRVDPAVTLRSD